MVEHKDNYAGFWLRLVAFILDQIVLITFIFIFGLLLGFFFAISHTTSPDISAFESDWILNTFAIMLNWIYYASMESSIKQATLGKMILSIKIIDVKNKRISFSRATGRFFSKFLSVLIFGIGFIMIAFTKNKQGLHDIITGCLVIKN